MKQQINKIKRMQQLAGVIKENENPSPNYNELVNAMETALKNYIKNAKGDPNVTLGGQLSTEEGEVVAKLVNLIKQVKQDSKYTIKEPGVDQLTEIRQLVRETINKAKRMQQLAGILKEEEEVGTDTQEKKLLDSPISPSDIKVGAKFEFTSRNPRVGKAKIEITSIDKDWNGESVYYDFTDNRASQGPYLLQGDKKEAADFLNRSSGKKL